MTSTSEWKGAVGFQLGNKLYVNMTGNVNDPTYLEAKVLSFLIKYCFMFSKLAYRFS